MSRIAGILSTDAAAAEVLVLGALRLSRNAGTDVTGTLGGATLGFTGTRAPLLAKNESVLVVLDGAIFNRDELGAHPSDAHLIAALHAKHGFEETLRKLNGDFAIALFDARSGTLWLGRDRVGAKPLFWARTARGLAFASRSRALLTLPGVSRAPDPRFVACFAGSHYRTFDNDPAQSPYAQIKQVPAATWMAIKGDTVRAGRYWALLDEPDLDRREEALAERYRDLLVDAVRIRLRSADRPAFTLSGGMDSSSVIACATREAGAKQLAYSTVYEDATYDETAEIKSMLDATVSEWRAVRIGNPDLASVVARMVEVNDEPVATATWLSHYVLCQRASADRVGTLFGGLGGDELNAGEYEYFFYFFADLKAAGDERRLAHETAKWAEYHDHPIYKKSHAVMEAGLARLVDLKTPGRCLPDTSRLARYANTVRPEYYDLARYAPEMDHPFTSYLKNRTYQDIYRETAPCCLRAADRQTAAFGLDVIWPFFDHRLMELMFRVPGTLKIRDGVTKHLLRLAMKGILPEETRTRIKKTGWNAPAHVWFTGKGRDLVMDIVGSRRFRERGVYDVERVRTIVDEHDAIVREKRNAENHMMFLWQLLNLETWFKLDDAT